MPEEETSGFLDKHISRRNFLRATVGAGLGLAVGQDRIDRKTKQRAESGNLPYDVISEERLRELGIEISQGTETQLYLRSGIFDFSIFKDLKEGKIEGVEIAIIDAINLDWRKTQNFSPDARAVFDAQYGPGIARKQVDQDTDLYRRILEDNKELLASLPSDSVERKQAEETLRDYEVIVGRRESAINGSNDEFYDYYLNWYPWGPGNSAAQFQSSERLQHGNIHLFDNLSPDVKKKNYIFLAVGAYEISPEFSFPSPETLDNIRVDQEAILGTGAYIFDRGSDFKTKIPSFSLRHELGHYEYNTENQADQFAYDSLMRAWEKLENGNDSGYCFVFKNDKGITTAIGEDLSNQVSV